MKTARNYNTTGLNVNESTEGQTLEMQVERMVANKEPIKDGAPLTYTERKEGVRMDTDIRTDRWEVAVDAMSKIQKSYSARREERHKPKEEEKDSEAKPIQDTSKA